jgi:hypothetical protein
MNRLKGVNGDPPSSPSRQSVLSSPSTTPSPTAGSVLARGIQLTSPFYQNLHLLRFSFSLLSLSMFYILYFSFLLFILFFFDFSFIFLSFPL